MSIEKLPISLAAAHLEIERLRSACAEAYQVMGVVLLGDTRCWTDDDAERALDNIVAAANGETCPHQDLLPWPGRRQQP